jgi:hypothetical protein
LEGLVQELIGSKKQTRHKQKTTRKIEQIMKLSALAFTLNRALGPALSVLRGALFLSLLTFCARQAGAQNDISVMEMGGTPGSFMVMDPGNYVMMNMQNPDPMDGPDAHQLSLMLMGATIDNLGNMTYYIPEPAGEAGYNTVMAMDMMGMDMVTITSDITATPLPTNLPLFPSTGLPVMQNGQQVGSLTFMDMATDHVPDNSATAAMLLMSVTGLCGLTRFKVLPAA